METEKIKLLVVDDSVFMRTVIIDLLSDVPFIEVVGQAANGEEAVKLARKLRPYVIIMDYKMPIMDGLEATRTIMETKDYSPGIIIFSAYTEDGIKEAFHGLRLGAIDFIPKPDGEFSPDLQATKEELVLKIRVAANAYFHLKSKEKIPSLLPHSDKKLDSTPRALVIGASTGGPPVIEKILTGLTEKLICPILVVQHMPPKFTSVFAELLNKKVNFEVKHAREGDELIPGKCYLARSGTHMKVEDYEEKELGISKQIVHLTKEPRVSGYRPSIDVLMKSVTDIYKNACIGIILTGMGSDGLKGSQAIHNNGGYIIAQSLQTAVIESMPSAIINAGIADDILSPLEIVDKINNLCK